MEILGIVVDNFIYLIVGILLINFYQRRAGTRSIKKRFAIIYDAALMLVLDTMLTLIYTNKWSLWLIIPAVLICALAGWLLRDKLFPFKSRCVECGKKLTLQESLSYDDNLCDDCYAKLHPEENPEPEAEPLPPVEPKDAASVADIDWDSWEPKETCVLTYLVKDGNVLLMNKKTGLGKGLVNAPGGHVEPGETAAEAAVREFKEEVGLTVKDIEMRGVLEFQFRDGLSMRGYVFFASDFEGELIETVEATPFWVPATEIPFEKMWRDDREWLPSALEGKTFTGRYIFDGETMVDSATVIGGASMTADDAELTGNAGSDE